MFYKACKHYILYITELPEHPNDAVIEIVADKRLVHRHIVRGLWKEYMQHLANNTECCQEVGASKVYVVYKSIQGKPFRVKKHEHSYRG
jgi:hypothetical protein